MMTEMTTEDSWQPIETAPRDGTQVIVYGKHAQHPQCADGAIVTIGHYLQGLDCWVTAYGVIYDAVYWMPLPAPPTKERPKRKTEKNNKDMLKRVQGCQRLRCDGGIYKGIYEEP